MKKILESVHSNEAVTSDKIKRVQEDPFTLKITDQHCRLAQPKFYGEEIQMDASEYI
ncbi:hypothetical protein FACS1894166_04600 [Bacilli bacterium]|nr:hypothetical protein FACS1894166_04600 [Bacilli bacterium]